jgi:hypothetical protein
VSTQATQQLFTGDHERPLEVIVELALQGAEADFALVAAAMVTRSSWVPQLMTWPIS